MDSLQNTTIDNKTQEVSPVPARKSPMATHGDNYINFCAVQGMIVDEDGNIKTMTAQQFADQIGVARQTLYDWQKAIPDFWVKVKQRRLELGGNTRIMKVYNGLFLKAATGNPQAAALWLANHDPNFRMPTQKTEVEVKHSWAALLNKKRDEANITEGEVVDEPTN